MNTTLSARDRIGCLVVATQQLDKVDVNLEEYRVTAEALRSLTDPGHDHFVPESLKGRVSDLRDLIENPAKHILNRPEQLLSEEEQLVSEEEQLVNEAKNPAFKDLILAKIADKIELLERHYSENEDLANQYLSKIRIEKPEDFAAAAEALRSITDPNNEHLIPEQFKESLDAIREILDEPEMYVKERDAAGFKKIIVAQVAKKIDQLEKLANDEEKQQKLISEQQQERERAIAYQEMIRNRSAPAEGACSHVSSELEWLRELQESINREEDRRENEARASFGQLAPAFLLLGVTAHELQRIANAEEVSASERARQQAMPSVASAPNQALSQRLVTLIDQITSLFDASRSHEPAPSPSNSERLPEAVVAQSVRVQQEVRSEPQLAHRATMERLEATAAEIHSAYNSWLSNEPTPLTTNSDRLPEATAEELGRVQQEVSSEPQVADNSNSVSGNMGRTQPNPMLSDPQRSAGIDGSDDSNAALRRDLIAQAVLSATWPRPVYPHFVSQYYFPRLEIEPNLPVVSNFHFGEMAQHGSSAARSLLSQIQRRIDPRRTYFVPNGIGMDEVISPFPVAGAVASVDEYGQDYREHNPVSDVETGWNDETGWIV